LASYIAAIDQGTTSTRCIIFNRSGDIAGIDQTEHAQIFPKPGWVEHDALEIWQRTLEVSRNAMRRAGLSPTDLSAVGITNQRETTLVWDRKTGKPYHNALVWQDIRTDSICNLLAEEGGQDRFRPITGLPLATYFSGCKIKWLLDHVAGLRGAAERGDALFGNIDTWLIWNMTGGAKGGVHLTDVTNASRTMLMNLKTLDWDDNILQALDIPRQILPQIRPSSSIFAYAKEPFENVPIAGVLGDQQAALFGQTCFNPGEAKNTYGTGCFMLLNTGEQIIPSTSGLLTTVGYQLSGKPAIYCLEGSIAITGALVQWMRDNLKMIDRSADIEPLARTVNDNGGIYLVPAFSGLFAPYWRSDARGIIAGMTRFTNRGHIARAVLESTAYQVREVLDAMEQDSGVKLTTLRVDGGMVVNDLLMQFQADLLNVPVVRPRVAETTALGAAYAAGLSVGFWSNFDELYANWGVGQEWKPNMPDDTRAYLYANWKKAVARTFNWID
jgi:glycerol kinase